MRLLAWLGVASTCLAGVPGNYVTISNNTGSTVNQPYTISRFFAKGEISQYPRPVGLSQWQSDVKTRWRDAVASVSVSGATNATPIRITTAATHGFMDGDYVTISGVLGNTAANGRFIIQKVSGTGFDLVNSAGNGAYISGGTATGPALGSVQHALISFWRSTATGSVDQVAFTNSATPCHLGDQATCTAAGLDAAGMLAANSGNWGAAMSATQSSTTYTTDARTLINAGSFTYWIRGPIATVAVVEDRTPARASDFGWTCSNSFRIQVDPATDTVTTYDYATGAVVTPHGWINGKKIIFGTPTGSTGPLPLVPGRLGMNYFVRNPTSTGFQVSGTLTGTLTDITTTGSGSTYVTGCGTDDYSVATWAADTTYRSLHPQFILTFFPGWSGVYVEYVMQNAWSTAIQDQRYAITLKKDAGNATTVVNAKDMVQYNKTTWVYRAWSGSATTLTFPSSGQIFSGSISAPSFTVDLNKDYIIYSKMTPQLDPRLTIPTTSVTTDQITPYQAHMTGNEPFMCTGATYCGQALLNIANTGGRGDIGWGTSWYIALLYNFDPRLWWTTIGNADIAGTVPYHVWEAASGKWYDLAHTIDAFGKPISINARPTLADYSANGSYDQGSIVAADKLGFIDPMPSGVGLGYSGSPSEPWVPEYGQSDPAHNPAWHYLPYMLTGDYFYLEDGLGYVSQYLTRDGGGNRHYDWGLNTSGQTRGYAWANRSMYQMALMTPDGWPEKGYFLEKSNANIAQFEALFGVSDGHYAKACDANTFSASTETSYYCWARFYKWAMGPSSNTWSLPLLRSEDYNNANGMNVPPQTSTQGMFQGTLLPQTWGWAAEVGFKTDRLTRRSTRMWSEVVLGDHPRDAEQYQWPVGPYQGGCALASNINTTTLTINCAAAPQWHMDPPFFVNIFGLASNGSKNSYEWVLICSVSGTTLTVCTNGRGVLTSTMGGSATSHSGDGNYAANGVTTSSTIAPEERSPVVHSLKSLGDSMPVSSRSLTLPFTSFGDTQFGYAPLSLTVLSYAAAYSPVGYAAYSAMLGFRTAAGFNYSLTNNPKLMYLVRRDPVSNVQVQAGDTFAIISYTAPVAGTSDAGCTVDGVSDGQSGSRRRIYVRTGLAAGTNYTSTIRCDADYYNAGAGAGNTTVTYTTGISFTGTQAFAITAGPGSSTAYLDYGSTPALGSTTSASCGSGCTLSATVPKGLLYYRVRRDQASPIQAVVVK